MLSPSQNLPIQLQQKTLKSHQLQFLIKEWLQHHKASKKEPTYYFKFSLDNILPLPQNLLQSVILYICYVKFPYVLEDLSVEQKVKTNLFLKFIYQQQFYHGKWKKQFYFQFTLIFLTKTASKFIAQYFPSLEINDNLESQIFIILHNVFIGCQIGTKIYQILSKKYLKQTIRKPTKCQTKVNLSLGKKDSFTTLNKASNKYISQVMNTESNGTTKSRINYGANPNTFYPQNVNLRRNNCRNKISFVKTDSWQRSNLQVFSEQLKKNLYVEPLPALEPKKMDISDYDLVKYGSVEVREKRKIGEIFIRPVNLKTTKISSSMETLITLNHPNLSTHHQNKPGKIHLTRQLNSKHYCLTSCSNHNDSNQKPFTQILDKEIKLKNTTTKSTGKFTYEEWNQLLKKIRFNSKNSTMFEKENINFEKPLDLKGQNHTFKEIPFDKNQRKDDSQEPQRKNNRSGKQLLPNKLLTENHQDHSPTLNVHRKSQSFQNATNNDIIEQYKFGKLGNFTTSIDPGNQAQISQSQSPQSHVVFKKQPSEFQQKLSKSSKLKMAKQTFLSECKKRQNKLNNDSGKPEIKMVMY